MTQQHSETQDSKSNLLKGLQIDSSDREPQPGNPRLMWMAGFLLIGFGLVWTYHQFEIKPSSVEAASIQTKPAQDSIEAIPPVIAPLSESSSILDATGYVTARRQATVSSQITGKVLEVLIEEGDEVVQGQLLARLDSSILMAQYRLSQSQLSAASAGLLELEVQSREAKIGLDRIQQLADRSLASQAELDQALLNLQGVQARTITVTRQVDVAKSRVQLQAQQLAEAEIRAPFSGVVINKAAQPGEIISPMSAGGGFTRTGICSIVDMNSLEIEVDVSESNINRIFSGQRVKAKLNSYPSWEIAAEVITIIPAADRSKATVRVRIGFLQKDPRVLPDMGVRVSFLENDSKADG